MIIGKIYGLFERANDDYVMKKLGMGREFFKADLSQARKGRLN